MNRIILSLGFLLSVATQIQAGDFSDWQYHSQIDVKQSGLIRLKISPETAGRSRPDLYDIRIANSLGEGLPYLLEEIREQEPQMRTPRQSRVSVEQKETVVMIETGAGKEEIEQVIVQTPSTDFLKSVTVEGSQDKNVWKPLVVNEPIFSKNGADKRGIPISPSSWQYLRLRIRDDSDQKIPVSGVSLRFARKIQVPHDVYSLQIKELTDVGTQTRLVVALPAKNLFISRIEIVSDNDMYRRAISVNQSVLDGHEITDSAISNGVVFKIPVPDGKSSSENIIAVQQRVLDDELTLIINNGMSPPLSHLQVKAHVIPSFVLFHSKEPQRLKLFTGNKSAPRPDYDLGSLSTQLQANASRIPNIPSHVIQPYPHYQPKDVLPDLAALASPIDVSNWSNRKAVQISTPGVQELELDMEALSLSQNSFEDLRIVQDGNQIPYLLWRYGNRHSFSPAITPLKTDKANESHYKIVLPHKRLALDEISFEVLDSLFERNVLLYEEVEDERGSQHRRQLNQTSWIKKPNNQKSRFKIPLRAESGRNTQSLLSQRLEGDTLILVIQNGDNPPLNISDVRVLYRSPKLVFKPTPGKETWLYFGNKKAVRPTYDIHLVKEELFESDKATAQLGPKEPLGPAEWWVLPAPKGALKYLFWGVLGLITLILIFVIAKLLPAQKDEPESKED